MTLHCTPNKLRAKVIKKGEEERVKGKGRRVKGEEIKV
jgi:hypothetical protein